MLPFIPSFLGEPGRGRHTCIFLPTRRESRVLEAWTWPPCSLFPIFSSLCFGLQKDSKPQREGKKKKSEEQKAHCTYLNVIPPFLYFEPCKDSAENGSKASQGKPSKVSSAAVILRRRDRAVALPPNGTCL